MKPKALPEKKEESAIDQFEGGKITKPIPFGYCKECAIELGAEIKDKKCMNFK